MAIKTVLLAAGKGTRLRPLTDRVPKVMVPINGKPVLEYHIERLARYGIRDIIINLHYLSEVIKAHFSDGSKWGVNIQYSFEPEILGTAGAVKNLEHCLSGAPFLVIYGDNIVDIDYEAFVRYSETRDGLGTIAVFEQEDVSGSGIVEIGGGDRILRFLEKPKPQEVFSHWVNAGVFWFDPRIFEFVRHGSSDFSFDVFPRLLDDNERLFAYKLGTRVLAIDQYDLLKKARDS